MKRVFSTLLSLTLTLASLPAAAEERAGAQPNPAPEPTGVSVSVEVPETPTQLGGNITFTYVPVEYEVQVTQALLLENSGDPDRVVIMTGPQNEDPVMPYLNPARDTIISAKKRINIPALRNLSFRGPKTAIKTSQPSRFVPQQAFLRATRVATNSRQKAGHLLDLAATHVENHQRKFALLVAVTPAGVYGTYWFMMTHSYLRSAGNAIEGFTVYALLGMFSKQWLHFSENVVGKAFELSIAKIWLGCFGDELSERARTRWRRVGELTAAFGMNIASMTLQYVIGGQWYGIWSGVTIAQYSVFSSHDVFDYPIKDKVGEVKSAFFVLARILGCMAVEFQAMNHNPAAEAILLVGVPLFSLWHVFRDDVREKKQRMVDRLRLALSKSFVGRIIKREKTCNEELGSQNPSSVNDAA